MEGESIKRHKHMCNCACMIIKILHVERKSSCEKLLDIRNRMGIDSNDVQSTVSDVNRSLS